MEWITFREARELLNTSRPQIAYHVRRGNIRRRGNMLRRSDVLELTGPDCRYVSKAEVIDYLGITNRAALEPCMWRAGFRFVSMLGAKVMCIDDFDDMLTFAESLCSVADAAAVSGYSQSYIRNKIKNGELTTSWHPWIPTKHVYRIDVDSLNPQRNKNHGAGENLSSAR